MNKTIWKIILSSVLFYILSLQFQFSHPAFKNGFQKILWLQIGIGFLPYLVSSSFGRISIVVFGLCLTRFSPISNMQPDLIFSGGFFIGGIFGIFYRELRFQKEVRKLEYSNILIFIAFLLFLLQERFLIYYNFPYLNGFAIQELMYNLHISSKEAFALSMDSSFSLVFPLLFLFFDLNIAEKLKDDYLKGFFIVILIQIAVISVQKLYDIHFLSESTNLSLEVNRQPGLFRDSGSSSFILPCLFFILLLDNFFKKRIYELILLIPMIAILYTQGRAYALAFFFSLFLILLYRFYSQSRKLILQIFFLISGMLLLCLGFNLFELKEVLMKIDSPRVFLNSVAFEYGLKNPLFGNGIGNFVVTLKDPSLKIFQSNPIIDNPGSFFSGIFFEVGIVGIILILLLMRLTFVEVNIFRIGILLPGFLIGYQIVHPDSAFLVLLLIFGFQANKALTKSEKITISFFFLLLVVNLILKFNFKADLFEFQKSQINQNQLLIYEKNKNIDSIHYHIFKGRLIWKLKEASKFTITGFLDSSTSRKTLTQNWIFLDSNKNILLKKTILLKKNQYSQFTFNLPDKGSFVIVEEVKSILETFEDIPFCIPVKNFTELNELISFEAENYK